MKANKCPACKALEENQRPVNAPKKTNDPCNKTAPIAIFKDEMEDFITGRYRKHLWLVKALGKNHVKELRNAYRILELIGHEGDVFVIRDYSDRVKCNYNNETQSGGMGGNVSSVGMEGFLYIFKNRDTGEIEVH